MQTTSEPLLTVKEVAEYLKLNPRTVSNKAQCGEIPATKVAGRWRFDPRHIREYITPHTAIVQA